MQTQNNTNVAGYSLFTDIEDTELRIHNQAQTLKNIMEDNRVGEQFTTRAMAITTKYFMNILPEDRQNVHNKLGALFSQGAVV